MKRFYIHNGKVFTDNESVKKTYVKRQGLAIWVRRSTHVSKKDIQRIIDAQKTGDWSEVHGSSLYNKYSGDYCALLEVIPYTEGVQA